MSPPSLLVRADHSLSRTCGRADSSTGEIFHLHLGVVSPVVWKFGRRILPVGEVHDQPAALAGGHRRSASWARVSASRSQGMNLSRSR
jgi:hypothetical protein